MFAEWFESGTRSVTSFEQFKQQHAVHQAMQLRLSTDNALSTQTESLVFEDAITDWKLERYLLTPQKPMEFNAWSKNPCSMHQANGARIKAWRLKRESLRSATNFPLRVDAESFHNDPDLAEVLSFLEQKDAQELVAAQDMFAHALADDDWLDTQESVAAAEEYLSKAQSKNPEDVRHW